MSNILTIFKKEMKSYFSSPAAYIILILFLGISGWLFSNALFIVNRSEMRTLFDIIPMVYLVVIPALTMGLISREKNNGTIELLTTFPIKDSEIILGKFFSAFAMIGIGLMFTLVHLITIAILGQNIDYGQIFVGYFGLLLLGGAYTAIGVFASTLTKNQVISLIVSFSICFFFFVIGRILMFIPSYFAGFFNFISIRYHMTALSRGVIDSRNLLYFISMIIIFLKSAITTLESRKW